MKLTIILYLGLIVLVQRYISKYLTISAGVLAESCNL